MISAGYSLCLGSESRLCGSRARPREGEEGWTGSVRGREGRVKVRERGRGRGREAGSCRDNLLFAAQRCTRAPACVRHMARHTAGNPSRVHVRGKCEEAHGDKHTHTHTHTHSPASVHMHMCTEAGIKCPVQMHRLRSICLSHPLHLHTSSSSCLKKHHVTCTCSFTAQFTNFSNKTSYRCLKPQTFCL